MEMQRLSWIDFCRGGGIFLVLLGHSSFPATKLIYGFHMPLFFLLSGLLWHAADVGSTFKKSINRLIIPYFIYGSVNLILDIVIHHRQIHSYPLLRKIGGILYSRGTTYWMPNCSPLWFLTCLFCSLCIISVLNQYVKKESIQWLIISFSSLTGYVLGKLHLCKLPWNIDTALMAILFIWIGYKFKRYIDERKQHSWILLGIGFVGITSIYFNSRIEFNENGYGNIALMLIGAFSLSYVAVQVSLLLDNRLGLLSMYLRWIGRNSLWFMAFDYFTRTMVNHYLSQIGLQGWMWEFLFKLIILSCSCYIFQFCKEELMKYGKC